MRLAVFADGDVGLAIPEFLIDQYKSDVVVVVAVRDGQIARMTQGAELPFLCFAGEEELIAASSEAVDLGLLAWWPRILKEKLLRMP